MGFDRRRELYDDRSAKRSQYQNAPVQEFWNGQSGRLPKGLALDETGRKIQPASDYLHRHTRSIPGLEAEERGQGEAIARNIYEMCQLKTPIICVIIGEGASGGALGIGVGDRVLMMENTGIR